MHQTLSKILTEASRNPVHHNLAYSALLIAKVEYPHLDPGPYLDKLDTLGKNARLYLDKALQKTKDESIEARVTNFNNYLFKKEGFVGNREEYEDPRNSCLNEVLDRRIGIPITLSIVYIEVAKRAGLHIEGINFPGHFLVRCAQTIASSAPLIIDPFNVGALLSEYDCQLLLENRESELVFDQALLKPATETQIVVRMLLNLKQIYVNMRSFPQAREVTEALLALSPSALSELRDRGLLAYHLNDLPSALHDLQTYLKLSSLEDSDDNTREEHFQIWEHVKTLRRRVASLN